MGWRGAQHAELAQREEAQRQGSGEGCPHGASSRPSLPDLRLPLGWQAGAPRTLPMCARRPWGGQRSVLPTLVTPSQAESGCKWLAPSPAGPVV